jgi:hypothetical protein
MPEIMSGVFQDTILSALVRAVLRPEYFAHIDEVDAPPHVAVKHPVLLLAIILTSCFLSGFLVAGIAAPGCLATVCKLSYLLSICSGSCQYYCLLCLLSLHLCTLLTRLVCSVHLTPCQQDTRLGGQVVLMTSRTTPS